MLEFYRSEKTELALWLNSDRKIYEYTNIRIEGEWHFLSKGIGDRMADGIEMDYTEHLSCIVNYD